MMGIALCIAAFVLTWLAMELIEVWLGTGPAIAIALVGIALGIAYMWSLAA